ncbi:MAG: hypothetical protein ACE5K4_09830 [Candidatus Hydrothermarchaeota archaeon]
MTGLELFFSLVLSGSILIFLFQFSKRIDWNSIQFKNSLKDAGVSLKKHIVTDKETLAERIDKFIESRSSELIQEWSLATKEDIEKIEIKVDDLEKRLTGLDKGIKEFRIEISEKVSSLSERLKKIEERTT